MDKPKYKLGDSIENCICSRCEKEENTVVKIEDILDTFGKTRRFHTICKFCGWVGVPLVDWYEKTNE